MRSLVALLCIAGCTHERSLETLGRLSGKHVVVETYAGDRVEVVVEAAPDGVKFRAADAYVPSSTVARVVDMHRGRGALEGLGLGAAVGAGIGAAAGLIDGDDECTPEGWCILAFSAGEKAVILGVLGAVAGGCIGSIVGAVEGSDDVYSFGNQVRVLPNGPPGSLGGVTVMF